MKGKISNPLLFSTNKSLFKHILKIQTPQFEFLIKKRLKHKMIGLSSFAILGFSLLIEIFFVNNLSHRFIYLIIYLYFIYYNKAFEKNVPIYNKLSIISEETYISFEQDYFLLSTNIREMSIPYDDPYLQIKKIYNDFHFICYWGEFTFSKTDIIEGEWEDLVTLLHEKSHIKE